MLLEALVACAGVTLKAVATAIGVRAADRRASAPRATSTSAARSASTKRAPVGFRDIRLTFEIDSDAPQEKLDQLLKLTERYCVVLQTLKTHPRLSTNLARRASAPDETTAAGIRGPYRPYSRQGSGPADEHDPVPQDERPRQRFSRR